MKKQLLFIALFLSALTTWAQAPQKFNYQGVARNPSGGPLASTAIGLRLSIRNSAATGTVIYQETQTVTTNAFGLFNVAVGAGTAVTGTFPNIGWSVTPKYLQVEMDPAGGTAYTDLGATQLLSVPFALNSANGINGGTVDYIPKFATSTTVGNSALFQNGTKIGLGTTTPYGTLTIVSPTDSVLYLGQASKPTTFGALRTESILTPNVQRVGILSTVLNASHSFGIGIEGFGNQVGVLGYGSSSLATQVSGLEGDAFGSGTWSIGVIGSADKHPTGASPTYSVGVYGTATNGILNYAGYFIGNVNVSGSVSKAGGTFKIDHPQDPENKYLYHSFVESPDMMNIYNGNITTDASGTAVVTLPSYFEALNQDFRYQLTVMGTTFAQAIVSKKVNGNKFEIKTNAPNVEVSWQVTGVRHDAWANANRVVPEVEKESFNKGKYISAKELGKPAELQIGADVAPAQKGHENANPTKLQGN
jgi:hypothetical protein